MQGSIYAGRTSPPTRTTFAPYNVKDAMTYGTTPATSASLATPSYIAKNNPTYGTTPPTMASIIAPEVQFSLVKQCVCEFFGTLILFLVVVLCGDASYFYTAFFYVALIFVFWYTSGAHLNPAISLALLVFRRIPLKTFGAYIVSQIAGGAIGGILFRYIFLGTKTLLGTKFAVTVVPTHPYTLADALVVQTIYTTMLIFVVLNITCMYNLHNSKNHFYGIAIGFVLVAGGSAAGAISSGALFNPALCVGLMVSSFQIGCCLWYALAELICAFVGVLVFKVCRYDLVVLSVGSSTVPSEHITQHYAMEFFGTFWFVITVCLNVGLDTGYYALSGGGALVSLIYTLGDSGGCFNPAVTLALAVMDGGRNIFTKSRCFGYIVVQLVAAILAGILASAISKPTSLYMSSNADIYAWLRVVFVEFFFTLVLIYVIFTMYSERHFSNAYYALVIGFTFFGASEAAYSISGGYLNPAVALGFAVDGQPSLGLIHAILYYLAVIYYWLPEFIGACLAAFLFRWIHTGEYHAPIVGAFATDPIKSAPFVAGTPPSIVGSVSARLPSASLV